MKRLLRFIAAAALCSAGLAGVGLITNAASAADQPCDTTNSNTPTITAGPGCAYVSVAGIDPVGGADCGTQVVVEDGNPVAADNVGYIGVSSCERQNDGNGFLNGGAGDLVSSPATGNNACPDRRGDVPSSTSDNTNGGGCYSLEYSAGQFLEIDLGELSELNPAFNAVPLPVGGDDSGDYNNTKRDGQGAAICDVTDTADNFDDFIFTTLFGPAGLVPNALLQGGAGLDLPSNGDPNSNTGVLDVQDC